MSPIYYANIVNSFYICAQDYPDNESWALRIHFCGCDFSCTNCCNPVLRNYNYQKGTHIYYIHNLYKKIEEECKRNHTNKVVLMGGDPLSKVNRYFTKELVSELQYDFDVCIYTGYTIDIVKDFNLKGFKFIKCGIYNEKQSQVSCKTDEYIQFASTNQILYDKDLKQLSNNGKYIFNGDNK